jgi:hypothetical protein
MGGTNSALSRMLDSDGNFGDKMALEEREREEEEEEINAVSAAPPGMCVECEDQPQEVLCEACGDVFCEVCFGALHRRGKRRQHVLKRLADPKTSTAQAPSKKARLVRHLSTPSPAHTASCDRWASYLNSGLKVTISGLHA